MIIKCREAWTNKARERAAAEEADHDFQGEASTLVV